MADQRLTAADMGEKIKEISVAEFFEKNRHLLGYENLTKALLTVVKEGVENSLDACEEAGILPEIHVSLKEIAPDRFKILIEDNGPGIVEAKLPYAFAKFLVGSKFHRLRQSRGIQGIGIHGAVLYSQLTTGKPVKITSATGKEINEFELMIDVTKNEPKIISHKSHRNPEKKHGISIELEAEGKFIERQQSIPEYLKETAIANPFAYIIFDGPNGKFEFKRTVQELPKQPKEIKPHPYGVELGILRRMLSNTKAKNIISFLTSEFSRVGRSSAEQICRLSKIDPNEKPKDLAHEKTDNLHKAMQMVKFIAPPLDCLSPLTENLITEGLKKELDAEFFVAITRPPTVYRGYPFQVSVGLAYGGNLPQGGTAKLFRFTNKVPLLYHQTGCAITEAVIETDWKRYGLSQSSGNLPSGPIAILVHFASVWVPFTSEGKQAIANYPDIVKEIKLALQDAGRKLAKFVSQRRRFRDSQLRKELFEKYIPELAESLEKLTDKQKQKIIEELEKIIKKGGLVGKAEDGSQEKS